LPAKKPNNRDTEVQTSATIGKPTCVVKGDKYQFCNVSHLQRHPSAAIFVGTAFFSNPRKAIRWKWKGVTKIGSSPQEHKPTQKKYALLENRTTASGSVDR
jgi:hypothetical protein